MLVRGQQVAVAKNMMEDWRTGKRMDASFSEWDSYKAELDEESKERAEVRRKKKNDAEARAAQTGWGGAVADRWADFSDVSEESEEDLDEYYDEIYSDDPEDADEMWWEAREEQDGGRWFGGEEERDPRGPPKDGGGRMRTRAKYLK
mmetsp:Transcript_21376/g.31800  ORF Transcript_21376/g.31800 Transcript_21376/m.31800 type:complete len:147 (+) Transcript_21376:3-443(+)